MDETTMIARFLFDQVGAADALAAAALTRLGAEHSPSVVPMAPRN